MPTRLIVPNVYQSALFQAQQDLEKLIGEKAILEYKIEALEKAIVSLKERVEEPEQCQRKQE